MELIPILKWRAKITHHGAPGEGTIFKNLASGVVDISRVFRQENEVFLSRIHARRFEKKSKNVQLLS